MPSPLPSTAVLMDLLRLNVADHQSASMRRLGGVITVVIDRFDLAN
jgi:hypothetical protein